MDDTTPLPPPPPPYRPYGAPTGGPPSAPPGPPAPPQGPAGRPGDPGRPTQRRRAGAFAAAVIGASLLVGAGAGVGGAAIYSNVHDDDSSSGSTANGSLNSSVADAPKQIAVDGSIESVAQKVLPSVVEIDVSGGSGAGSGSGIVLSSTGRILTNNHVVEVAGDSGTINVSFNDGTHSSATIVGTDPLTDTALIQADNVSGLTPATIGKSANLSVGQAVVAIGSPFGLESTVTSGIVSALDRPVDVGSSDDDGDSSSSASPATIYPAIQTDAAINPGNSGGALVDLNGNVIGINASIRTADGTTEDQSGSIGLGFAIPMDEVIPIVEQMAAGQTPTHARLGISVQNVGQTDENGDPFLGGSPSAGASSGAAVEGAKISANKDMPGVTPGSAADKAGLAEDDVITKVDDRVIVSADSLVATVRSYRPGDEVTLTYERGGQVKTTQLTLDSDAGSSNS